MEDPPPDPACHSELWDKPDGEDHRSRRFDQECTDEGVAHHADHAVHVVQVKGGHHDQPFRQADTPTKGKGEQGDDRHETQSTHLNHRKNDDLTEMGPVHPGVDQDQTGHAGRGGRGKKSGHHAGTFPAAGSCRQRQQYRTDQDNQAKGRGHNAGRVQITAKSAGYMLDYPVEQEGTSSDIEQHTGSCRNAVQWISLWVSWWENKKSVLIFVPKCLKPYHSGISLF